MDRPPPSITYQVEAAAKLVGEFLVPIDDEFNSHKQQQLRQLALINGKYACIWLHLKGRGPRIIIIIIVLLSPPFSHTINQGTLREEGYCNICGEKGHRQFECPLRHSRT